MYEHCLIDQSLDRRAAQKGVVWELSDITGYLRRFISIEIMANNEPAHERASGAFRLDREIFGEYL
jgi:hypothetical protein